MSGNEGRLRFRLLRAFQSATLAVYGKAAHYHERTLSSEVVTNLIRTTEMHENKVTHKRFILVI